MRDIGKDYAYPQPVVMDTHREQINEARMYGADGGLTIRQHTHIQMVAAVVAARPDCTDLDLIQAEAAILTASTVRFLSKPD